MRKRLIFGFAVVFIGFIGFFICNGDVQAYETTCRAWSIGVEGGEDKNETVCVVVNDEGKAETIEMQNNSLLYYYDPENVVADAFVCLSSHYRPLFQYWYFDFDFMDAHDCTHLGTAIGLPDDPVSILNKTEELLKRKGLEWNGSVLTGEVEGRTVDSIDATYDNPSGVVVIELDCSIVGGEPTSDGKSCKNTEQEICENNNGTWVGYTADDRRRDSTLKEGMGTCTGYTSASSLANSNGEISDECRAGTAMGGLGWLLCPMLNLVRDAANGIYDMIEPMLRIEPGFFNGDNGNISVAWETFRDLANIVFVILLLAVIFSQITGVGINNYGIKKILPKLIVAAILINLSYVICQIAVDLSNILGNGLQNLFVGLGNNLNPSVNIAGEEVSNMAANVALPAASILAGVAGVAAVYSNPMILVSLLISAFSVIISMFVLLLLLVAREAAVVVLVAISPIAIVCYMLPNTKSLFSKWVKAMEGMLLLYPICGLIVGGGGYVSKLLLNTSFGEEGFIQAFAAMIVGIIPICFIPTIMKSSFAAIGNIGAKISGIGQGLGRRATGAITNTDAYKGAQEISQNRATRLKMGLDKNGNLTAKGKIKGGLAGTKFGQALGYDKTMARSAALANKNKQEQESAAAALMKRQAMVGMIDDKAGLVDVANGIDFKPGSEGAYYGNQFLEAAKKGDASKMNAAIQAMNDSNMQAKDIAKIVRYGESNGAIANGFGADKQGKAMAQAWRGDLAKQYGGGFLATDAELSNYMSKRGDAGVGMTMNYGQYAANGGMDVKDLKKEDIAKLSGDSLAGMATSGTLTKEMAESVLADNPNMSVDKKIMLGAIADSKMRQGVARSGAFKTDAEELAKGNSGTGTIYANAADVEKWTKPKPQDVKIVP